MVHEVAIAGAVGVGIATMQADPMAAASTDHDPPTLEAKELEVIEVPVGIHIYRGSGMEEDGETTGDVPSHVL